MMCYGRNGWDKNCSINYFCLQLFQMAKINCVTFTSASEKFSQYVYNFFLCFLSFTYVTFDILGEKKLWNWEKGMVFFSFYSLPLFFEKERSLQLNCLKSVVSLFINHTCTFVSFFYLVSFSLALDRIFFSVKFFQNCCCCYCCCRY